MDITERIDALRCEMKRAGIDIYIVPSADFHQSEYVGGYFKSREFITGFTGSAGTAVITAEKAGLWTDGRYFIQAEKELASAPVTLFRSGEPGVDTIGKFLEKELPSGGVIGFDGRTTGVNEGRSYADTAEKKGGRIEYASDLIGEIWADRPELPDRQVFSLGVEYAGESAAGKLARVRGKMKEYGAGIHLLSSLDDIAWLLNLRGGDVAYCPVFLSYLLLYEDCGILFADEEKFPRHIREELEHNRIRLRPYDSIYSAVSSLPQESRLLIDPDRLNYTLYQSIPKSVDIIRKQNPEILMKCIKNDVEIKNIRNAHIKDAVAHTRFMRWLKTAALSAENDAAETAQGRRLMDPYHADEAVTEISASKKLEQFRSMQDGYLMASFAPISAFAEHGAIVHYSADKESDAVLSYGKMLLTDTGGHYWEGSTDITRTVALGEIPQKEKEDFTLVARAMLRLMNTVFLHGCSGANLDCIAREVFWKERVNFNHGTGHGVGYLLSIHEPPVGFRWKESGTPAPVLEKNMVVTDEPGIYIEGSHGVRLENELLVCTDESNGYGQFMRFEPLTFVPLDLDAILPEKMTAEEREMLNVYHKAVYEKISPYLDGEERAWLAGYTRPV